MTRDPMNPTDGLRPSNPAEFRAKVIRRAAGIERRRRIWRGAAWSVGVIAIASSALVLMQRRSPSAIHISPPASPSPVAATIYPPESSALLWALVTGSDGNLWATAHAHGGSAAIIRVSPDGTQRTYELPGGAEPDGIVSGADGALWFTDPTRQVVGRITTAGAVTTYNLPAPPSESITLGPDGALWVAEPTADKLAKITPGGAVSEASVPAGRGPDHVATGPDGNIWFGETHAGFLGRVAATGAVTELPLPTPDDRITLSAIGPGPSIWFQIRGANGDGTLGHIDGTSHMIIQPAVLGAAMSLGPDGRLWLPGANSPILNRVGLDGSHPLHLDRNFTLHSLSTGSDGAMWGIDEGQNRFVRIPGA